MASLALEGWRARVEAYWAELSLTQHAEQLGCGAVRVGRRRLAVCRFAPIEFHVMCNRIQQHQSKALVHARAAVVVERVGAGERVRANAKQVSPIERQIDHRGGATFHESVGVRPPLQSRRIARGEVVKQVSRNCFDGGVLVLEKIEDGQAERRLPPAVHSRREHARRVEAPQGRLPAHLKAAEARRDTWQLPNLCGCA